MQRQQGRHHPRPQQTQHDVRQGCRRCVQLPQPKDVTLKPAKDWKIAGKRIARLDTVDKTTGKQVYGMDLKLPGMLNAAMTDCPIFGGKVKSFDEATVMKRPGVKKVVRVGDSGVAVIADTWWRAKTALDALKVEWDPGPNAKASSEAFAEVLNEALESTDAVIGNDVGNAVSAIDNAARRIEAVYSYPHQNHACMEVMNATVKWTPERCEVWVPTQNGEAALAATAGGCRPSSPRNARSTRFISAAALARRGGTDYVRKAVLIAKEMPGVPIKMLWSREEDMAQGRFHPVTQCKLVAGLDDKGEIAGLHMRIAGQSILATVNPQMIRDGKDPVVFQGLNPPGPEASIGYTFPALRVDHAMRNPSVPAGFWRGVNLNQNTIYLECFIDEIAHATQQDPLALRRKLMARVPSTSQCSMPLR